MIEKFKTLIYSEVNLVTSNDLNDFFAYIVDISDENLEKNNSILSLIFLKLINRLRDENIPSPSLLKNCIRILNPTGGIRDSYMETVKFLYKLMSGKEIEVKFTEYDSLFDNLKAIDWIFDLEEDSQKIFPLHIMVSDIVTKFKEVYVDELLDDVQQQNDILYHLLLATKNFVFLNIDSKDDMIMMVEEVANNYNIEILKFILNGATILFNELNTKENNVIIVSLKDEILIRSNNADYFDDYKVEYEVYSQNTLIPYVKVQKQRNSKFISLKEYFQLNNNQNNISLLSSLIKTSNFNVFSEKSIIVTNDNKFVCLTNPFGKNDKYIIVNQYEKLLNTFDNFLKAFDFPCNKCMRLNAFLHFDHFDVLYFGYVLKVFKLIFTEIKVVIDFNSISFEKTSLNIQTDFLIKCLESIENSSLKIIMGKINVVISLVDLFEKHNKSITIDKITEFLPYDEFYLFDYLLSFKGNLLDFLNTNYFHSYNFEIINFDDVDFNSSKKVNIDNRPYEKEIKLVDFLLFDEVQKHILFDYDLYVIIKKIRNILSKKRKINYDKNFITLIGDKYTKSVNDIISIMINVELNQINYNTWFISESDENIYNNSIALIKIMWHFYINAFNEDKVNLFLKLFLKNHNWSFIDNIEENTKKFFSKLKGYISKKYKILTKERVDNDTTLAKIVYNYGGSSGQRNEFLRFFNDCTMNHSDTKLIYVTDNITSGASTCKGLLNVIEGENDSETFNNINFCDNYDKSKLNITILTFAYCKEFLSKEFSEFIKKYNINIDYVMSIGKEYIYCEKTFQMAKNLYSDFEIQPVEFENMLLFFRLYNLPAKFCFPYELSDTSLLVSLFNRRRNLK